MRLPPTPPSHAHLSHPLQPTPLLGGLSPQQFMRRHWHKKPLLVRQAVPGVRPPLPRAELFALAAQDDVESRLVTRHGRQWQLRHGPLSRRQLPALSQEGWTLLVQGLDLHVEAAHALLSAFRFVPAARLDDLMISYASHGGGVGPHVDAYDVFLLQVSGRRRWSVARAQDLQWRDDVPLKMLRHFEPEQQWLLEPGDMLYLPPHWAHDGVAVGGDCMTCSVGFRSPSADELARELLLRLADDAAEDATDDDGEGEGDEGTKPAPRRAAQGARRYRDAGQPASAHAAAIPESLGRFAVEAVRRRMSDPRAMARALGAWLTEPKPQVVFEAPAQVSDARLGQGVRLHPRSRMLYDARHLHLNGESFVVSGRDATLMRRLADTQRLSGRDIARLTPDALAVVQEWLASSWLQAEV
jgi:50S ribosomal protein L16 3-hydroxylase